MFPEIAHNIEKIMYFTLIRHVTLVRFNDMKRMTLPIIAIQYYDKLANYPAPPGFETRPLRALPGSPRLRALPFARLPGFARP